MITVTAECLRRRDEAHRIYQAMPPVDELPPFVHLSAYASMAELAAAFDDRETAAQMYRLLLPHADLFVCGGAGVIMIRGSVRYPLGVAAATMGRPWAAWTTRSGTYALRPRPRRCPSR